MSNQKAILKYVVHLMLLIPFLVSFVNFDSALSGPLPPNMPQIGTIVQSEEVLSTPDLIQQAFMRGEIVEDERLLYLAYALGDSNKLPTRFYSNVPWSGTMVALELNNILQSTSAKVIQNNSTMMTLQQFLSGDCGPFSGDLPNVVSTAHFYIEYDNILGGLDINDYVYALESAWNGEILNFGWAAPPVLDSNPPPGNLYHVRIQTLSIPGGAFQSGSHAGLIGDNPNTSWNDIDAYASCIVLNRDYSAFLEFGTRQEVLSITVAHELTHAIQYGYGALTGSNAPDLSFIESSATWMEEEIFETADVSIVDQRLWPRFDMCMGQYHYDGAPLEFYYSYWNVFRGLTERFGVGISGGGEDVMQDFWEETSKSANSNMLSALNTALVNKGTTLADAYHDYAIAVKFNKACGGGYVYPYCLKESPEYVQAVGAVPVHGKISAVGNSYAGGLADNYSLNWISLPTRGIYSVTMENKSEFGGQFRVSIVADTGSSLQVTPLPDVVIGNSRTILAEYQPPDGAKSVVAVITNQSQTSDNPFLCFSNPYKLSVARPISFVIDDTGSMANEISMVKTTVTQKVDEFVTKSVFPNYHLLTYKDVENYRGETADPNTIKSWVNSLGASGGGDCPEEMLGALNRIAIEAPYSEAWVLTDAGFHGGVADVARTIFNLQNAHIKTHFIVYSWCFEESSSSTLSAEVESTATDQSEDGQDSLALVSELTTLALGPESFVQIANETGGHYFQISSAETQAAASILLNEMVATSDLAHFTDEVVSTSPKIYSISIDSTATEANFLLNVFSGSVNLTLIDPNGVTANPSYPGVTYTSVSNAKYYQVANPVVGIWQAQISGNGTFAFSTSGNSSISLEYLSDTSLAKDKAINLLTSLVGPVASASFRFVYPDGTLLEMVSLFDDGLHGDGLAGDGVYGGAYTPTTDGSFYFAVEGTTTDNTDFKRVVPELIRVQTLSVVAPANREASPGTTQVYDFSIVNGGTADDTFDLAVTSSQGWADLSGVPASITMLAGVTEHVLIPVDVPITAAEGLVDELVLTAVSQSNPLVHDSDSVHTTVVPNSFPSTPVLDDFNRANGSIGSDWSGNTFGYTISSNKLNVDYSGSNSDIYWGNEPFGADQEAYVTLVHVDTGMGEQNLLLKSQSNSTWGDGVLEVLYDPTSQLVQVWTYEWPAGWVQHDVDIPVTFVDGDQFGARALADGTVEVYRNGELLATRDITAWSHYADGGYIGLWFIGAEDAVLDDFGGGTISDGMQTMSMSSGAIESQSIETSLTPEQLNVTLTNANVFWQGVPIGSNQKAYVTFAQLNKTANVFSKPQSNGAWGEGIVQVLYDVAGSRIQVWMYDTQKGWVQYGADIPVKFAEGDKFSVRVLANGTVEIQRNGKLLAKRDVTP